MMRPGSLLACALWLCSSCSGKLGGPPPESPLVLADIDADGDGFCIHGYEDHDLCPRRDLGVADCDDEQNGVHPGAVERCDGSTDDNCDGVVDENCSSCVTVTCFHDGDGDSFGDPNDSLDACEGALPDHYVLDDTDCNDADEDVFPGAGGNNDCVDIHVTTAAELRGALSTAAPGTTIQVAAGDYAGKFDMTVSGDEGSPIVVVGPAAGVARLSGDATVGSWRGVLEISGQHHIIVEGLEIRSTAGQGHGVFLVGDANDGSVPGCHHIVLRDLYVHDVSEELIKVRSIESHDILIEDNIVHSNADGSGIDIQGHWPNLPDPSQRPRRIVVRNNLIYDVAAAGIGNEIADNVQSYNNVVLGSPMGLDIGCGNFPVIVNNLVTSYTGFNALREDESYTAIDLSRYNAFSADEIASFPRNRCADGIALSGGYVGIVADNLVTDCTGDLLLSYNHQKADLSGDHNEGHGHANNGFFRNRFENNDVFRTIREYDRKENGATSNDQMYFNNVFANNSSQTGILFEHSVGLKFFNNTLVHGDDVEVLEESTGATVKNNVLLSSLLTISADSTGANTGANYESDDLSVFVNGSEGDFRLAVPEGNACIDSGDDVSDLLQAWVDLVGDHFDTELDFYDDDPSFYGEFPLELRFFEDLNGNSMQAPFEIGAYVHVEP